MMMIVATCIHKQARGWQDSNEKEHMAEHED